MQVVALVALAASVAVTAAYAGARRQAQAAVYTYSGFHEEIRLEVSGRSVGGKYLRTEQTSDRIEFECTISGSFNAASRAVTGQCTGSYGYPLAVRGFKAANRDAFQLTMHAYTYALRRFGVSGTWRIDQLGGGQRYTGTLNLKQEGETFTGRAAWDNHQAGSVSGRADGYFVEFKITYSPTLQGIYKATLNKGGNDMTGGTARSSAGGPTVSWFARRQG